MRKRIVTDKNIITKIKEAAKAKPVRIFTTAKEFFKWLNLKTGKSTN